MSTILAVTLLPLVVLAIVATLRRPLVPFAVYAALIPFASGITVPLGLPPAFSTLSTLVGMAAGGAAVAHLLLSPRRAQRIVRALPLWLLFFGWAALSYAWSINPRATGGDLPVLASLIGLYALMVLLPVDGRDLDLIEAGIVLGGVVTGLYGVFLFLTGDLPVTAAGVPRFETGGGGEGGDPNITAAKLLLPLLIAIVRGFGDRKPTYRAAYLASALAVAAGMALTASRGGILAGLLGAAVLAFSQRHRVTNFVVWAAVAIVLGALLPATAGEVVLAERLAEGGTTGRTHIWRIGLAACPTYCWTGSGWGTFPDVHEDLLLERPDAQGNRLRFVAHNIFLGVLIELGLPGLVLLAAALWGVIAELIRLPHSLRAPPLAAVTAVLLANLFLSNLEFKYFWLAITYAGLVTLAQPTRRGAVDEELEYADINHAA